MKLSGGRVVLLCLLGISFLVCSASAVRASVIPFAVYPEQPGSLQPGHGIPEDFSMACFGHSFLSVYYWNTAYLNTTADNPVPLNQVLDLHVHCPTAGVCSAQSDYRGDPEKSEWCVLTTSGEVLFANISNENLRINCSGTEIQWDFDRCLQKAEITFPCENYYGSHKFHCLDSRNEAFSQCDALYSEARNQSTLPDNGCEIHMNMTPHDTAGPGHVEPAVAATISEKPESAEKPVTLFCKIIRHLGMRCV